MIFGKKAFTYAVFESRLMRRKKEEEFTIVTNEETYPTVNHQSNSYSIHK